MSGFGTQPFGGGPFGVARIAPDPQHQPALAASRRIDGVAQDYVLDAAGNPASMDGTDQRVMLLVAYAETNSPIITPQSNATQEQATRAALAPLLTEAAITALNVAVVDDGGGSSTQTVAYQNAGTNPNVVSE